MAENATRTRKTANPKTRPDDARGTPKGAGTVVPAHGGRIGNPGFEPTETQRAKVRQLAKQFPMHGERYIAAIMGFSRDTLRRHFEGDMELGRAEMLSQVASQMIIRSLDANAVDANGQPLAKGDLDAQKFVLARLGGWTTKVDIGTPGRVPGGEPDVGLPDLSQFSDADLQEYGRLAAIAEGLDPDEVAGSDED